VLGDPELVVDRPMLLINARPGQSATPAELRISNNGSGIGVWRVTASESWVTVSNIAGVAVGDDLKCLDKSPCERTAVLTVSVDPRKIKGSDTAVLRVQGLGVAGETYEVADVSIATMPAYNTREEALSFHPRSNGWVGYVVELGGTTSGEHGDGRLRAAALRRLYGPEVVGLFAAVKQAFDPAGVLNPGVIVPDGASPLAGLKVGPAAASIPDDIAHRLRHRERAGEWALPPLTLIDPDQ